MLILFAAGNDGDFGNFTIGSPAHSKNALSVGCSENTITTGFEMDELAFFSSIGPSCELNPPYLIPCT